MAFVPIAMAVIGAVGAFAASSAESAQQDAAARQADYRQTVARMNAEAAGQQASAAEESVRRESRQQMGRQRAAFAQAGLGFTGSVLDVGRESAINAELDALNVRYEGAVRRTNFRNEMTAEGYNAQVARKASSRAKRMRWLNAASGAVGGYTGVGGSFGGGG